MCAAGGLRQSGESDAGARIERSRADFDTSGARRSAKHGWCANRWSSASCWRRSAGLWASAWLTPAHRLILHLAFQIGGPNNYVPVSATPSLPVLLFTLGMSVLTGIIFGIAPAWMTSHADPIEALRGANRSVAGRSLVGAEIAGDRAGRDVAGTALGSGAAGPEPA